MPAIDQAQFQFNETAGLLGAIMVGFLVFAVALDLRWDQLARVIKVPKAPLVGLAAQFGVLPAIAFAVAALLADTPSIAVGLLLVACCPAGALSNYLTGVAKGDVATSVTMTATSTAASMVMTPLLFALWASFSPQTHGLLRSIDVDPKRVAFAFLVMVALPVTLGMVTLARFPAAAIRMRIWTRRMAMLVFAAVVIGVLGTNLNVLAEHGRHALLPVALTFGAAVALGWTLARVVSLSSAERRAVTLEVGMQNVALAIGMAMAFFPRHAGVAITAATWGAFHLVGGFALATHWASAERRAEGTPLRKVASSPPRQADNADI